MNKTIVTNYHFGTPDEWRVQAIWAEGETFVSITFVHDADPFPSVQETVNIRLTKGQAAGIVSAIGNVR